MDRSGSALQQSSVCKQPVVHTGCLGDFHNNKWLARMGLSDIDGSWGIPVHQGTPRLETAALDEVCHVTCLRTTDELVNVGHRVSDEELFLIIF